MNVRSYPSATAIAEALLADRSVTVPAHRNDFGSPVRERRYDLASVGSRISEDTRRLIESVVLTDMCEGGRLLRTALHRQAAELANELWKAYCAKEVA